MRLMAGLISSERTLEKTLKELGQERDLWLRRSVLAQEDGDHELADYALKRVEEVNAEISSKNHELGVIVGQKEVLKERTRAATHGGPSTKAEGMPPMEDRFRELEKRESLKDIRRRSRGTDPSGGSEG